MQPHVLLLSAAYSTILYSRAAHRGRFKTEPDGAGHPWKSSASCPSIGRSMPYHTAVLAIRLWIVEVACVYRLESLLDCPTQNSSHRHVGQDGWCSFHPHGLEICIAPHASGPAFLKEVALIVDAVLSPHILRGTVSFEPAASLRLSCTPPSRSRSLHTLACSPSPLQTRALLYPAVCVLNGGFATFVCLTYDAAASDVDDAAHVQSGAGAPHVFRSDTNLRGRSGRPPGD